MQYSFKLDLEKKRREATVRSSINKVEQMFRSFANLIDGVYGPEETLSTRTVCITMNKVDVDEPIIVKMTSDSVIQEGKIIKVEDVFSKITFKELFDIFEDALQKDKLNPEINQENRSLKDGEKPYKQYAEFKFII